MKMGVVKILDSAGYVLHVDTIWTATWAEVAPKWVQEPSWAEVGLKWIKFSLGLAG